MTWDHLRDVTHDRGRGLGLAHQALRYALSRQGMLAMTGAPLRAFVRSREGLEAPDLMLGWIPMLTEPGPKGPRISRQSGLTLYAHAMPPESKGHVHITAADPRRPPAINFNFLSSPPDAELTVRAVRIARKVMTAPAMAPFQVSELLPGTDRTTDDEILDWVKEAAETTYHPVGTCKMGPDPMAVVDAQLRVHSIAGLRVADASILAKPRWLRSRSFPARASAPPAYDDCRSTPDGRTGRRGWRRRRSRRGTSGGQRRRAAPIGSCRTRRWQRLYPC